MCLFFSQIVHSSISAKGHIKGGKVLKLFIVALFFNIMKAFHLNSGVHAFNIHCRGIRGSNKDALPEKLKVIWIVGQLTRLTANQEARE